MLFAKNPVRGCISALLLLGLVVGCAAPTQRSGNEVEDIDLSQPGEEQLYMPAPGGRAQSHSAVDALLASADSAIQQGEYQRAAAYAERAIRLAPRDGRAYFGLAQIHYYQNRPELGSSFLAKAESLAADDKKLLRLIQQYKQQLR